jgi:hypothetical protein
MKTMCKKYGFKEDTPEFNKCLLDEQRGRHKIYFNYINELFFNVYGFLRNV